MMYSDRWSWFSTALFSLRFRLYYSFASRGNLKDPISDALHLRRDVLGFASVAIWFFTLGFFAARHQYHADIFDASLLALNFILLALWKKEQPSGP